MGGRGCACFYWRYAEITKTWLYNYTTSIYHYDSSDWNSSRYRNDDTGFNIDAGLAADFGENWTLGLSGQNLVSRDIDTKEIYITNGISGETTHYKDTYQIRPWSRRVLRGITRC